MLPAVAVNGLDFTYRGGTAPAIRGVDLTIVRGEFVALMGHSGGGKSTLCLAMTGLIPRSVRGELAGSVELGGRAVSGLSTADTVREIGMVFQDYESQLFSTSVQLELAFGPENLAVPRADLRRLVEHYLDLMDLTGMRQQSPASLSGGQKQRVAIAAALALEPQTLVLDESTTDLDPVNRAHALRAARHVGSVPRTLLVVEHDAELIGDADRVVLLDQGTVVADGAADDVLRDIALLERCGVRPPQLAELFHRLELRDTPMNVDDAALRLRRELPRVAPVHPPEAPDPPLLEAVNLTCAYPDATEPALRQVSLRVWPGEFVALIGQNGSGKTTLAKALSGLITPIEGEVRVAGRASTAVPRAELVQEVGYVFQNPDHQLFSATVAEEVRFGPRNFGLSRSVVDQQVTEALRAVTLEDLADRDPFSLSMGERQRLAIASVLAMRPTALILDEPTTGLDYRQQLAALDMLVRLNRSGHTIIIVTHAMPIVAEYARRVVVMAEGRIVLDGPPRQVFREESRLAEAGIRPPEVVRLSNRLGTDALDVAELTHTLIRAAG